MSGWKLDDASDQTGWQAVVLDIRAVLTDAVALVKDTVDHRGGWAPKSGSQASHELRDPIWGEIAEHRSPLHWGYVAAHLRIVAAIDYLESLNALLQQWPPHPWGPVPLARAAIESSARARWLLDAELSRRERALRMIAERLNEELWKVRVAKRPGMKTADHLQKSVLAVADLAEELGVKVNRRSESGWPKSIAESPYPKLDEIIPAVLPADDVHVATSAWRGYAGVSHGSPLGVMNAIDVVTADDGSLNWDAQVRVEASETATLAVGAAYALLAAFDPYVSVAGWSSSHWRHELSSVVNMCTQVLHEHA